MLNGLQNEINRLFERGFDRTLRLAVTGLSRSGKTAFITSLINQLLHINQTDNRHLPLFSPARNGAVLGVKRLPQQNLSLPRFDYDANLQDLQRHPPVWCQSTKGISETRLALRYQRRGLTRHLKEHSVLYLDIFDYPGEWLLDLPLLSLDFQQWSMQQQDVTYGDRAELAAEWRAQEA